MSGHTPGPWHYEEQWQGTAIKAGGSTVARVNKRADVALEAANARLIAAAPELLEEIKEIREWFRQEYSRDDSPEGMFLGTSVEKDVAAIDDVIQ